MSRNCDLYLLWQVISENFASPLQPFANPYTNLQRKIIRMTGHQSASLHLTTIKTLLTSAPVLGYPSTDGSHFVVDCDASNVGIGSVPYCIVQNGEEKVIGYFSRCLSRAERKYCTTRKELLAVVAAVRHFHHCLYGRQFIIWSYHGSLQWLLTFKNGEGQLARFLETLSAFTFKLEYRA